jgi:hypothetical protein
VLVTSITLERRKVIICELGQALKEWKTQSVEYVDSQISNPKFQYQIREE